jgi:hypothetical protein
MGAFKKFIGWTCGVIGGLLIFILLCCLVGLIIDKTSTTQHFFGWLVSLIFVIVLFGLPFYFLILKPKYNISSILSGISFPLMQFNNKYYQQIIDDKEHTWKESIEQIIQTSPKLLKPHIMLAIGKNLYNHYLSSYINDSKLSAEELADLNDIASYFKISEQTVNRIKNRYNKTAVYKLSKLLLSDKQFSPEDRAELIQFASALNMPAATAESINRANALEILKFAKEEALNDSRLTDEEENELIDLTDKLGLNEDDLLGSLPEQKKMTYCKLMWEVENGKLPEIASPIILQKNEICHFAIDATRLETKTVTTGYSGGSRGVSVRIAKGVSYRVGAYRAHPVKEEVTYKYPGNLVITSKRIVFVASEKGFSMLINKLDNIEPYRDGLGFQKGTTYYLLTLEYPDLVGLIISGAVNRL